MVKLCGNKLSAHHGRTYEDIKKEMLSSVGQSYWDNWDKVHGQWTETLVKATSVYSTDPNITVVHDGGPTVRGKRIKTIWSF